MHAHSAFARFKSITPSILHRPVRAWATALLTPFQFSVKTGHFRSSLAEAAVSPSGEPLPWYTYPCIDILSQHSFNDRSVLEFGSGQSTIWWSKRADRVTSFENDPAWYDRVSQTILKNTNITLVTDWFLRIDPVKDGPFDIAIVDGLDRARATELSIAHLAPGGALIIDNSEGSWGADGSFPIIDLLAKHGFQRVDFYGFAPGVIKRACTSIAFKDSCFLFSNGVPPRRFD